MPALKRYRTKYKGVYYVIGTGNDGKPEKVFYIRFQKNAKEVEEKAGWEKQNDMTAAKASRLRAKKTQGEPTNRQQREKVRQERATKKNRQTFNKLFELYLKDKPDLKGKAQDVHRFTKYIKPAFGNKLPSELTPLEVDRLRLRTLKGRSPQTIKNTLAFLKRLARFGVRKRLCSPIPFEVELPKVDNLKTEDLDQQQMQALLNAIEQDKHPQAGDVMKLALFTGMRKSEMLKLRWEDVDFEKGFIRILNPKGGKTASIPLNEPAKALLQGIERNDAHVFPGRSGARIDIHKATKAIANAAGLPPAFRPLHGLRHVYASMLASSGKVDLYTISKLLNHRDPTMVRRYAHLRDATLRSGATVAGEIVNNAIATAKKSEEKNGTDNKVVEGR